MTLPLDIPHVMTARALLERQAQPATTSVHASARVLAPDIIQASGMEGVATISAATPQNLPAIDQKWGFEQLRGRLIELNAARASAALSFSAQLIAQAQRADLPVAWIAMGDSLFFPPDMHQNGVDLQALALVWPDEISQAWRALDALIRADAFGLVVVDLRADADLHPSQQHRLARMAERYDVAVIFLNNCFTIKTLPTITRQENAQHTIRSKPRHALRVSLRVEASRRRLEPGTFGCTLRALKDGRYAPGWTIEEVRHGTPGLR